jgi:excisionase family DNA binding protein
MKSKYISTGQAAHLCSVTPGTVLKWIHSGWLRARRTPGGHHRIDVHDLKLLVGAHEMPTGDTYLTPTNPQSGSTQRTSSRSGQVRYCWEYQNREELPEGCRECAVFQMRAFRCYEVAKIAPDVKHNKIYCHGSCADCDYYIHVHKQVTNVMVVTRDPDLTASLESDKPSAPYNLEITDCEYSCSALVDRFRADYIVVDSSLGSEKANDICNHLLEDPRLPFVRVVMAVDRGEFPESCDKKVFARIGKPFHISDIAKCLDGPQSERGMAV